MDKRLFNLIIDKECSICYNQVSIKDYYITKPCIHLFHNECVINSFKITKNKCPYCNTQVKIEIPKEKLSNLEKNKSNFLGFINVLGNVFTNITDIDSTNFINDIEEKVSSNEFDSVLDELYKKYKK